VRKTLKVGHKTSPPPKHDMHREMVIDHLNTGNLVEHSHSLVIG